MSALPLLLACLAQAAPAAGPARVEPASAAVGEPLEVVCEVEHPAELTPRPLAPELDPSAPFVFLDARREPVRAGGEREAAATRLVWRFAGLAPGKAAAPAVEYAWRDAQGEQRASVAAGGVELAGVLAEGEDAPRPLLPFRTLPEEAPAGSRPAALLPAAGAALALALLALGYLVRRRRLRRRAPAADARSPSARLAELRAGPAGPRARHYELTRLVREAFDRRAGVDLRGLTDEEWARELARRSDLPPQARDAAARVLAVASGPKYAGERPTEFRERETFDGAAAALEALEAGR